MALEAVPVDPRDVNVEVDQPVFRVHFWADRDGLRCREYEVRGADVDEVVEWAEQLKTDAETYVVGVLTSVATVHGADVMFTRIKGTDPSRSPGDGSSTSAVASG